MQNRSIRSILPIQGVKRASMFPVPLGLKLTITKGLQRNDVLRCFYRGTGDEVHLPTPTLPSCLIEVARGEEKPPLTRAELALPSAARGFHRSDATAVSADGREVEHTSHESLRMGVISTDHVSVDHSPDKRKMEWVVDVRNSYRNGVYIGVSKASRWQCKGFTMGWSIAGDYRFGNAPNNTPVCDSAPVAYDPVYKVRVEVDLDAQVVRWTPVGPFPGNPPPPQERSLKNPMGYINQVKPWHSARLWVSLLHPRDRVSVS